MKTDEKITPGRDIKENSITIDWGRFLIAIIMMGLLVIIAITL